jgi:hypothetical protein
VTAPGAPGTPGATADRAAVIHLAGLLLLSPALDAASRPALSAAPGDGLRRCGWAPFFAALEAHGLAVEAGSAEGPARLVPRAAAARAPGVRLRAALARSRRFWKALFPPAPPRG